MPVELLAVAAEAEIIEHRLEVELDRALEVGPALDADLGFSLEVDELGAQPEIEPLHTLEVQPDEIAQVAGGHLDLGGIQVRSEDIGGFWRRGVPRRELAD